jgi:uncharacterized protein (TIGR02270 family)
MAEGEFEHGVLWDVVEEHFDEAAYLLDARDQRLDAPNYVLDEVARGPERRWLAHVDGVLEAGTPVVARLLGPSLAEPDATEPGRITTATYVLLLRDEFTAAASNLRHPDVRVRRAAGAAFALHGTPEVSAWVHGEAEVADGGLLASLLAIAARLGQAPRAVRPGLESADPGVAEAAARTAAYADPAVVRGPLEALLVHPALAVRCAALPSALRHRTPGAWAALEREALDRMTPTAMILLAALGGPGHHDALVSLLGGPHRPAALRALGLSGSGRVVPSVMSWLAGPDRRSARLAAEALATITGCDAEVPWATPRAEVEEGLPDLDDDLARELVPAAEELLPEPDDARLHAWWGGAQRRFHPSVRYLGGCPYDAGVLRGALERSPTRRRHALAALASIELHAHCDPWALASRQRAQIAAFGGAQARAEPRLTAPSRRGPEPPRAPEASVARS